MKKNYLITYEENNEIKTTRWTCKNEEDPFLSFIDSNKWIIKIEEIKR